MRHAIVTGSTRGIGLAVARTLLERGWRVTGVARSAAPACLGGPGYEHVRLDLSDLAALEAWLAPAAERWLAEPGLERLGLVNDAGRLGPVTRLGRTPARELATTLALNAVAPALLSAALLERAGHLPLRIVDLSSGAANSPYAGWGGYCASKAALAMLGRVLALECEEMAPLAGRKLALVSYSPNVVDTAMQAELRSAGAEHFPRKQRFVELHAQARLVPPEGPAAEIADLLESDSLPLWSELRYSPPAS